MGLLAIDIRTVILLLWMGNLIAVSFLAAYSYGQRQILPTITPFFISRLAQTIAWILLWLRGTIPDILSMVGGNSFLYVGWAMEALSITSIRHKHKWIERIYIVATILSIPLNFAIYQVESANIRVAIGSFISIALFILPALILNIEKSASLLQRGVGTLYLFFLTAAILRAAAALTHQTYSLMTPDIYQAPSYIYLFWLMMFGSIGYLLLLKEKTDQELVLAANIDHVTNIFNRRTFFKNIEKPFLFAIREHHSVALLTIDIDNFKTINDTLGHPMGDLVLKDFANSVQTFIRPYDLFGRLGGDEFVILLPKTLSDEALAVAKRIQTAAKDRLVGENKHIKYTVSIGVCSLVPETRDDLEELVRTSDLALLEAKNTGRNRAIRLEYKKTGHSSNTTPIDLRKKAQN